MPLLEGCAVVTQPEISAFRWVAHLSSGPRYWHGPPPEDSST